MSRTTELRNLVGQGHTEQSGWDYILYFEPGKKKWAQVLQQLAEKYGDPVYERGIEHVHEGGWRVDEYIFYHEGKEWCKLEERTDGINRLLTHIPAFDRLPEPPPEIKEQVAREKREWREQMEIYNKIFKEQGEAAAEAYYQEHMKNIRRKDGR